MTKTEAVIAEFKAAHLALHGFECRVVTKGNGRHFYDYNYYTTRQLADWAARYRRAAIGGLADMRRA